MKKTTISIFILTLSCISCVKTRTCTCKDSSGNVILSTEKKSTNRSEINKFEDDCKKHQIVNTTSGSGGTTSQSIPCEVN